MAKTRAKAKPASPRERWRSRAAGFALGAAMAVLAVFAVDALASLELWGGLTLTWPQKLTDWTEAIRNIALALAVPLGVYGAYLAFRRTRSAEVQSRTAAKRQITDTYTTAVGQLGEDRPAVRIGAIYALEQIARDSPSEHGAVVETLCAFIRDPPPLDNQASANNGDRGDNDQPPPPPADANGDNEQTPVDDANRDDEQRPVLRADVAAALSVLGRRDRSNKEPARLNLRRANLVGAQIVSSSRDEDDANFDKADFSEADLSGASLLGSFVDARFDGTDLSGANLIMAKLDEANFTRCKLDGANFGLCSGTGAEFAYCSFDGIKMTSADFTGAFFLSCVFQISCNGIVLNHAKLYDCNLAGPALDDPIALTDLTAEGVSLTNCGLENIVVTSAKLHRAVFDRCTGRSAVFTKVALDGAVFSDCKFKASDFGSVDFGGGTFFNSQFVRCEFMGAKFTGVTAKEVDFGKLSTEQFDSMASTEDVTYEATDYPIGPPTTSEQGSGNGPPPDTPDAPNREDR